MSQLKLHQRGSVRTSVRFAKQHRPAAIYRRALEAFDVNLDHVDRPRGEFGQQRVQRGGTDVFTVAARTPVTAGP